MNTAAIGKYLAELRRAEGLTQEELGTKFGVTNKTVSRWETGAYLPPVEALEQLSALYGVTVNELISARRLEEREYMAAAEENVKAALKASAFGVRERMDYFKKKWRREHRFELVLKCAAFLGAAALGLLKPTPFGAVPAIAFGVFVADMIRSNNDMMAYVESRAFGGSANETQMKH